MLFKTTRSRVARGGAVLGLAAVGLTLSPDTALAMPPPNLERPGCYMVYAEVHGELTTVTLCPPAID